MFPTGMTVAIVCDLEKSEEMILCCTNHERGISVHGVSHSNSLELSKEFSFWWVHSARARRLFFAPYEKPILDRDAAQALCHRHHRYYSECIL